MRNDLTDITLVVDRSGSMQSCIADAEGGINTFIVDQKAQPNSANFTLVQFDNVYEFVHNGVPISEVGPFNLVPRGGTALLDAVGRAINETGARLAKTQEADRPKLVVFVIVTDGGENASVEFTKSKIREMVERQTNTHKWTFVYLGANQDAFAEAGGMGIATKTSSGFSTQNSMSAYRSPSSNLAAARSCVAATGNIDEGIVCMDFIQEQRDDMA